MQTRKGQEKNRQANDEKLTFPFLRKWNYFKQFWDRDEVISVKHSDWKGRWFNYVVTI